MNRILYSSITSFVFAIHLLDSGNAQAGSREMLNQFLEEYQPAAQRIEAVYFNIQLTEHQWTRPGHRSARLSDFQLRWLPRGVGREHRMDILMPDDTVDTARIVSGDLAFAVRQRETKGVGKEAPTFHYVGIRSASEAKNFLETTMTWIVTPFASYTVYSTRIDDFIRDPKQQIILTALSKYEDHGVRKAKLSFRQTLNGQPFQGHFIFLPDDSWVLLEYRDDTPLGLGINVEYGDRVNGVPIVKKAVYRSRKYHSEPYLNAEVIDFKTNPAPPEMFVPEAFGLPDVPRPQRGNWILLPLGLGGLALSALLAVFVRRRRTAA